ncbi:MAG: glycosyltransferase family 2 protein [Parcubacteria group bacterium]|nr:glycosyltransferase family 2 protein [Parcubacteria group bacterium]
MAQAPDIGMEKISVVIVHYRSLPLLKLCLKSLFDTAASYIGDVVVVNNASEWETEDIIRERFSGVRVLAHRENVGYARGVNRGLAETRDPYVLILNPDIVIRPHAVQRLHTFLRENPRVGAVGPRLINFNGTTQISYSRFYTPLVILFRRTGLGNLSIARSTIDWFTMKNEVPHDRPTAVDWLMGSAMLIRRSAVEKVGMMDEHFFMYFEDVDWCRRFWAAECHVIYFPGAEMYHYHQRASHGSSGVFDLFFNRLTRTHLASAIYYFRKYGIRYPAGLVIPYTAPRQDMAYHKAHAERTRRFHSYV